METFRIRTLVDITNTRVKRPGQGSQLESNQYKNWITLNQCVELRSIIGYEEDPKVELTDLKGQGFGKKYKGKHNVWTWTFTSDRERSFDDGIEKFGLLINDLDQIPIIKNLTETVNIDRSVFEVLDVDLKNTIIEYVGDL